MIHRDYFRINTKSVRGEDVDDKNWEEFCDWVKYHKRLKRVVIQDFSLSRLQVKTLKSALNQTQAPVVELDMQSC